jgi:hypothetical protein
METLFEYKSSWTNSTKKVNSYNNLTKKIDEYKNILNLVLPVYLKEYCVIEESICYQIEINDKY